MKVSFKKKQISIPAKRVSSIGKFSGLMFRTSETKNLLFEFNEHEPTAIHSFFVFFPFLALWLDENNSVKEFSIVKPFTPIYRPKTVVKKLLELPLNRKNQRIVKFFVDKGKI